MAKTPDQITLRQDDMSRYYDAAREREVQRYNAGQDAQVRWYICYFGDAYAPNEIVAEEDVLARDKSEASAVMRAALARDFEPGCKLIKVTLA